MDRIAILQVADTGPLESLVDMLSTVGYQCVLPDDEIKHVLRSLGCDNVTDISGLMASWGYEAPMPLPVVSISAMDTCDLYVDVKGLRNGPLIWKRWPRLEKRTLWYRINGGKPEHVIRSDGFDCGDEVNPPCPILTPNRWYADTHYCEGCKIIGKAPLDAIITPCDCGRGAEPAPWLNKSYCCWPPFHRFHDHQRRDRLDPTTGHQYGPPICLVHNLVGWGYGAMVAPMRQLGIRMYGGGSPDGLVNHADIPNMLANTIAMVHLKSSDAPGYSLYEALATACPIIVSRRLIWRNRMEELFEPGVTCLAFDVIGHQGLTPEDVANNHAEISAHLLALRGPEYNRKIGEAGRQRLKSLLWDVTRDAPSLREFMTKHFGG